VLGIHAIKEPATNPLKMLSVKFEVNAPTGDRFLLANT
jgi:hypothetical protein